MAFSCRSQPPLRCAVHDVRLAVLLGHGARDTPVEGRAADAQVPERLLREARQHVLALLLGLDEARAADELHQPVVVPRAGYEAKVEGPALPN